MKTKIIIITIILFFGISCTDQYVDEQPQTKEIKLNDEQMAVLRAMRGENNRVSQDEVIAYANDVITFLDGESMIRSGQSRRIETITALTTSLEKQSIVTRAGNDEIVVEIPDTVAYVVNFADSAGFTIIAADTRIPVSVLAYVADGNLGTEVDDPGMAVFLEGLEGYIYDAIIEAELQRAHQDPPIVDPGDDGSPPPPYNPTYTTVRTVIGAWETTAAVYPLSPVEWDQGSPFNELVRFKNCSAGTAPTGCVAVATAHIMSYWKQPAYIDGYYFNWATLNNYTGYTSYDNGLKGKNYKTWPGYMSSSTLTTPQIVQDQVARLMERIGAHIGMKYDCSSSGTESSDAISFLKSCGYKSVIPWEIDYDYDMVIAALNVGWPVLAGGYTTKVTFLGITIYYEGGHEWVIDGYLNRRRYVQKIYETWNSGSGALVSTTTTGYYEYWKLLHHNWGRGGTYNGYFTEGSFNSHYSDAGSETRGGEAGNYQYNVEIAIMCR